MPIKELPQILINLKAYESAIGKKALDIAKAAERVYKETGVLIGVAPQPTDIQLLSNNVEIPIFAQHIDPIKPGAHTGLILPEAVKEAGAIGILINHSERPVSIDHIKKSIEISRNLDLLIIVFASDLDIAKAISILEPNAIAVEPPELIGTGISISKAKPDLVKKVVEEVEKYNKRVRPYVGAGVSNKEDVMEALKFGVYGVAVASAITKAKNPYEKILELAQGVIESLE